MFPILRGMAVVVAVVSFVLSGSIGTVSAAFSVSDLAGTWYGQSIGVESSRPQVLRSGSLTIDATGAVTGGTYVEDTGAVGTVTGGAFTIDSAGQVSGSTTSSLSGTESHPHGKLDAGKTILITVDSASNWRGLSVAIKGGGTFAQADLAGTWYFQGLVVNSTDNDPGWSSGTLTINAIGAVTGGSGVDSWGDSLMFTGGAFTIDGAGQVTGSIVAGGTTLPIPHGKLDARETILTMVSGANPSGAPALIVAIKGGGTFTQADLAGTWYFESMGDTLAAHDPGWTSAIVTVNTTGEVTGGTFVTDSGVTGTFTGGALTIDGAGQVTGFVTPSIGSTQSFPHGKLDASKTILALVSSDPNWRGLSLAIKGGDTRATPGDFNADGHPDLLWQHATSGDVYLWTMNGSTQTGGAYLAQGMGPWKVVSTADFTGDGKPDLLWQHATSGDVYLWTMNGTTMTSGSYLAQWMGGWKVVATGDFCGNDGKPDLVWQHDTSGDVYLWCMNGTTMTSGSYLAQGMGPWKVVGAADFNGDGKPDLLWQHETSGDVYLWTMNGTTQTGGTYLAQNMGAWKIAAVADLNNDGKPDLLWQHATTGDVYLWTMNGITQTSGAYLAQGMGSWKVVGPK